MVAKISTGKSIRGMLHYNENKVGYGEARLILASGFAGEIERMNFNQKLNRFHNLTMMKPNVKTNAVHISLNFHSSEELSNTKLQQIANCYMEKIGFGDQPFLVYRHDDSAHDHIHIVTTNITAQRQRMDLHDIGIKLSEPARKAIEEEFNLVRAESKTFKLEATIKRADPAKAMYGHLPTKRAISNVIIAVTRDYKFTSLAELNVILKCFNVVALRGAEHTLMFEKKGLMFSLLNAKGEAIGVPIKASAFYTKPSLRNLEKKFEVNREKGKAFKEELKQGIDQVFGHYTSLTKALFIKEVQKLGIDVVFRQNEQGLIFGITFIDHPNKVVFNGSDLGKAYSAKAITEKFRKQNIQLKPEKEPALRSVRRKEQQIQIPAKTYLKAPQATNFLTAALAKTQPDFGTGVPKKKRRKKRGQEVEQKLTL
ncbi:relaxase/mobilization nuclease domain-containing protein [Mucilaginibacter sp.]|uniref:relaxase/mobilization nuclease domain-containing protein n=1 Tax=Mucilaginibacter sp. TaxID=1882438 RepID=UPI0025F38038|nr:relaxase/mobilization nuclease domain-containing protein [Mucilaginibacter sp.]